jgi:hypothetical protein
MKRENVLVRVERGEPSRKEERKKKEISTLLIFIPKWEREKERKNPARLVYFAYLYIDCTEL